MPPLLFLAHRIPYPPEKGEKIRAWRILQHLARRFEVHLGCLHDRPEDAQHVPFLREICASVCCPRVVPWQSKLRSLAALTRGEPLTLGYFENAALRRWVETTLGTHRPSNIFVFSSAMASYVPHDWDGVRVLDMVDVDSDKWRQYAAMTSWPLRAIYRRESRTLLDFERRTALEFDATLLVSRAETAFFQGLAPAVAGRVHTMRNGIDTDAFDPRRDYVDPYPGRGPIILFTGAMDYWPNVQAAEWFTADILPALRQHRPELEFYIVGINPSAAVRRLAAKPGVVVTGRVVDVRPYLKHASVVVAPLKIARGVQNKILEAMAMGKPVIATHAAYEGIEASPGSELLLADEPREFVGAIEALLSGAMPQLGRCARERILQDYQWNFDLLDGIMANGTRALAAAG